MDILEIKFKSCSHLKAIVQSYLGKIYIVQMENGALEGVIKVIQLENINILIFLFNYRLALVGERDKSKFHIFTELNNNPNQRRKSHIANDISISSNALFGYNFKINNHDLVFEKKSKICCISGERDFFNSANGSDQDRALQKILLNTNARLTLIENGLKSLFSESYLSKRISDKKGYEEKIMKQLYLSFSGECLIYAPPNEMSQRSWHAYKLLSICSDNKNINYTVEQLARLLNYSRTSLTKACEEKFGLGTLKLMKAIKLDQARYLFTNQELLYELGLRTIADVSYYCGFQNRSYFARQYNSRFKEMPSQTFEKNKQLEV